jgi:ParB/RepB/Spo0J family partition protein
METQTFQEIVLSKITPNPMNPRKTFAGPKFDELTDSIRQKGVIEPILVRPVKKGFEIVAGERRFRASCRIAKENGGIDYHTIPAMVRELSDDDAFDIMTIENLQREDLNELEEAEGFKLYLDKKGPEALTTLAERTGISETYIRRRVRILSLPKAVLKKWEKGEMLYGHLEQLMRLGKEERAEIIAWYEEFSQYRTISIGEMKRHIDQSTLKLSEALFDTAAAGCGSCTANTDCQKHLFGDDFGEKETICLNPTCFKRKQAEFLTANWDEYKKKYKSNGFRFEGELKWGDYEMIYGKLPSRDCRACEKLCTIISFGGIAHRDRVCLDPACFKQKLKESDKAAAGESTQEPQRPYWHGRYFREKFYKKRIPEVLDR